MHVRSNAFLALVAIPLTLVASACGGKASAELNTPTSDPNAPAPYIAPTPTGPASTPTAAPPPATSTGAATPIAPMAAAVVQPILVSMGQNEAQGAQPDGSPFAGQFAAGQTLEQTINIRPNGCYTVVAASIGIQQLDIQLVANSPVPGMPPINLAQSSGAGPNATLGGRATGCWRNPTPLAGTGKVILRATSGQGLAAAQVFVK